MNFRCVGYRSEYGLEVVRLWRRSFQRAMGIPENDDFEALTGQLDYLAAMDEDTISVLIEPATSLIVGFMALSEGSLDHLYIHIDRQGRGLGSWLLERAKSASGGAIELYTFQRNVNAQAFYLAHGFREIERGYASEADNPWATAPEQLADIRYRWEPGGGTGR